MKKTTLFFLVILCLLFGGCGRQSTQATIDTQIEYDTNACGVPDLQGTIHSAVKIDSRLYAGVYQKGVAVEDGRYSVVMYDISDETYEKTILQGKEEMAMWSFTVLEDGNYKALFFIWDSNNRDFSDLCLITFDTRGNIIEEQDITQEVHNQVQDTIWLDSFCMDRSGKLYFYTSTYTDMSATTKVYSVDPSGGIHLIRECSGNILGMQIVSSKVWMAEDIESKEIRIYDLSEPNTEDSEVANLKIGAKTQAIAMSDGLTDSQKIIDLDANVYQYDLKSQQLVRLFSYEDVELEFGSFNTGKLIATAQEEFYVLKKIAETDQGMRTYDWMKITKSEEVSQREILTIAVAQEDSALKDAVTAFNKTSKQYKAVVRVYEADDINSSSALLQADIVAGNIPDMIAVDAMELDVMIHKGLLHDLSDFMEGDLELSKSDFVGRSLEIYTRNNEIYAIPQCISILALTGKQKMLGNRESWDIREFEEFVHTLPNEKAATLGISKDLMLHIMMEQYMSHFVDWEKKTCYFESPEFMELLQFVNMYPDSGLEVENSMEKLVEMFQSDEIVLYPNGITDTSDYQIMKSLWGEEITYIGFPTTQGSGIQLVDITTAYAITENSTHKEEMWQIIKYMTTDSDLVQVGLPAYQPLFDLACENAMKKTLVESKDGTLIENPEMEIELAGMKIDIYAATEEDIAMIKNLINKAEPVKTASSEIEKIIQEEAWGFFSNQKDVETVAGVIQNRVSIYLNE